MNELKPISNQRKLKNILVNPRYQIRYALWTSFIALALALIMCAMAYYLLKENYAILVDLSPMTDDSRRLLYQELQSYLFKMMGVVAAFLFFVLVLGIRISHRVAGPLYKFKKVFEEVQTGNKDLRIKLRPEDDFQDVAAAFNNMMDRLIETSKKD